MITPPTSPGSNGPTPRWPSRRPHEVDELDQARSFARVATALGVAAALPRVGAYSLLERIGAGGMGVVYAAFDRELNRRVAVKVLRAEHPAHHDRLRVEARALARLSHPHVVAVHAVGVEAGRTYVAMALVEGSDLRTWARAPGRRLAEILRVFAEAGTGLAAAHDVGVVHRDFKPANVLVDCGGRARVADFGIATMGSTDDDAELRSTQSLLTRDAIDTRASRFFGTPAYMAPEQHRGLDVGAAADQYAFCVALVDVVDGRLPFDATTPSELGLAKAEGSVVRPAASSLPEPMWRVIERGLSPEPEDRFPSMAVLLEAFDRSRRPPVRRTAGVAAVGALAAGAAIMMSWRGQDKLAEPCSGFEAELVGVWDQATRDAVANRFQETGLPHAEDVWRRVEAAFDAQAEGWVERREAACRAEGTGELTAAAYDARQACLRSRWVELQEGAGRLRRLDRAQLLYQPEVSPGEPLQTCDTPWEAYWLQRRHPRDVERAREIEAEMITADTQERAGQIDAARQTYAGMREAIAASPEDFPSVRAALARRESQLELDPARKQALVDEAVLEGLRTHYPRATVPATMDAARHARDHNALERARELIELGLAENRRYAAVFGDDPSTAYWTAAFEAELRVQQGLYFDRQGQPRKALQAYQASERALAPVADQFADRRVVVLNNIAEIHRMLGEAEAAERTFDEAVSIARRELGERAPRLGAVLANRAGADIDAGRPEAAMDDLVEAIAILEGTVGPDAHNLATPLVSLGQVHAARGELELARAAFARSERIGRTHLGAAHPYTAFALGMLGVVDRDTGWLDTAVKRLDTAVVALQGAFPDGHPLTATMLIERGDTHLRRGQLDAAEHDLEAAVAMLEATDAGRTAARGAADTVRASLAMARGDPAAARASVASAIELLGGLGPSDRPELVRARGVAASLGMEGGRDD